MKKFFTSLRGKLISISIIPLIGFSIFMYVSLNSVNLLGEKLEVDHTTLIPNSIAYGEILAQRIGIGYFALQANENRDNPKKRKDSMEKMRGALDSFKKAFETAEATPDLPEETEIMKKVRGENKEFMELNEKLYSDLMKGTAELDNAVVNEITSGKWNVMAKTVRVDVSKVLDIYKAKSKEMKMAQAELRQATKIKLAIFFVVINLINIIILILIGNAISKKMSHAINILQEGSEKVGQTSKETAETSTELSASVTETAAALQETTSSVEETSSMIARNAENAKQSMHVADGSKKSVEKGLEAVKEMTESINEISNSNNLILTQVEDSNKEMQEIVNLITEIGNKTKLINDIVFQTKLLSFNASVEAARAGEHGKGFAVVAEEVGNLAKMSGDSATEISNMLENSISKVKNIADSTRSKVDVLIRDGKTKVEHGVKVAEDCSVALKEINANVERVYDLVQEISSASQEQAQGMNEINKAMLELDNASSLNNQISQRVSHSAEELKREVDSIRTVISELTVTLNGQD